MLSPWKKNYDKARQHIKKQRHHFANQGLSSQSYDFPSTHVQKWELDHKEGWAPKNWCFQIVVLGKTLESSFDSKEIKPVNLKGNQLWISLEGLVLKAQAPILWPPDAKSQLRGKDSDTGKDWKQMAKRTAEDDILRLHHRLNGQESEQTPGDSGGQRSLVCCSPWVRKELDTT